MNFKKYFGSALAGLGAGTVNGLFGAGGGMVLIPLLTKLTQIEEDEIFPSSVSIILPICLISLSFSLENEISDWKTVFLYLAGSAAGGVAAGLWGRKIPVLWLHRALGLLIHWGGFRYLC